MSIRILPFIFTVFLVNDAFADNTTLKVVTAVEGFGELMVVEDSSSSAPKPIGGFEFDLFNAVCRQMRRSCDWRAVQGGWNDTPFLGILNGLKSEEYDVVVAFLRGTQERFTHFYPSAAYLQTKTVFYSTENSPLKFEVGEIPHKPEGEPVRFATVGAYKDSVIKYYAEAGFGPESGVYEIIEVSSDTEAAELELEGIADFSYSSSAATVLNERLSQTVVILPEPSLEWGPRFYTDNPFLTTEINLALQRVVASGEYKTLLQKYHLDNEAALVQSFHSDPNIADLNIMQDFCRQAL
ncbi:MAG: ABC transporter substrate-binding protein [Bdellovibrionales bacterium]|nr:ABC transporter substrate-binding protein [Bdellovibrionales bacterium]